MNWPLKESVSEWLTAQEHSEQLLLKAISSLIALAKSSLTQLFSEPPLFPRIYFCFWPTLLWDTSSLNYVSSELSLLWATSSLRFLFPERLLLRATSCLSYLCCYPFLLCASLLSAVLATVACFFWTAFPPRLASAEIQTFPWRLLGPQNLNKQVCFSTRTSFF